MAAQAGGRAAAAELTIVIKDSGRARHERAVARCRPRGGGERRGRRAGCVDIDLAAYRLMQDPLSFDVIAAPNLFGDVLADLGAVLLVFARRVLLGELPGAGAAVYQTNHGSALDLAGQGRANPLGQIAAARDDAARELRALRARRAGSNAAVDEPFCGPAGPDRRPGGAGADGCSARGEMGEAVAAAVADLAAGGRGR